MTFQEELDRVEEQYHGFYSLTANDVRRIAEHFYNLGKTEREAAITSVHLCGVDVGKGESVTTYAVWDTHENTYPFSGTLEQCRKYIEEHDPMGIDMSVIP